MRYKYIILMVIIVCEHILPQAAKAQNMDISYQIPTDTVYHLVVKDTALPGKIIAFAKTLIGTPYKFGCASPNTGFDCSGFITYIFNHFDIAVPRSSADFTNTGITVPLHEAKPGDLILFTGTNNQVRTVGHIGIIVSNDAIGITFIHSSSGKENAVTITPLNDYYMGRLVKVIRYLN